MLRFDSRSRVGRNEAHSDENADNEDQKTTIRLVVNSSTKMTRWRGDEPIGKSGLVRELSGNVPAHRCGYIRERIVGSGVWDGSISDHSSSSSRSSNRS